MKQKSMMKKLSAVLLTAAMTVSTFPQLNATVFAADTTNELPTVEQFATVEQLKSFNTISSDNIPAAKVYFGENQYLNEVQQWWIVGSQQEQGVTLFAASPLAADQQFEPNSHEEDKQYSTDWDCDYTSTGGSNPSDVWPSHYGASSLRATLKSLETLYFTGTEQGLMNDTTIYTDDVKNDSIYSTTDKLYLAYGDEEEDGYITVGTNSSANDIKQLNNGLRIDASYWGNSGIFWLRAPTFGIRAYAHIAELSIGVSNSYIFNGYTLMPAFELNLSSVLFASAAPAASSGDVTLQDVDGEGAFTLRYDASKNNVNLGSALVSYDKSKVTLTDIPTDKDVYLVAQTKDGAKAKQITTETEVSASTMGLDSFANCKVWLETTVNNDRMTYATFADEKQGYDVNITASEGLTVTNGTQDVAQGSPIADIIVEVSNGYYLPDDYISNLQGKLNGLTATETDNGFTISGTPTSDVNITLPAATVLPKSDTPIVEFETTSTSITATVTNHKTEFGDIEYKWNDGTWEKDKNILSNLDPDTTYKFAVRFTGNGFYQPSDEFNIEITTLKDGNIVIVVPTGLTTTYKEGLTLSDVDLSNTGWTWLDGTTALSAGTKSYPATFDTTALESTHDFSSVDGYDKDTHKVTRDVQVEVKKADSMVTITTLSLDKAYDGKVVSEPEYTTSGSDGKVTITWQKNTGTVDTPKWEDLKSAPSSVGNYQVIVSLGGNDNYNSASATLDFTISKADNAWIEELSITGWTYNETATVPTAKAKFGEVTFTYSSEENGTYTNEVPKNAGTYYVKASVAGTENYTGLESTPAAFEIAKAIPAYEKVTGVVLGQGQALSKIELPEQFKWVNETMTADELGTHTFKAIYTPEDTANYQTIEVEIEVEVVPTPVAVNHVPTISASDKTITVGDKFDPMKDVMANDKEDGDLTSKIKVISNTVDTKKAGTYEVTYQVTDSQGATVTKTIKVTVKAVPINPDTDKPNIDKPSNDRGSVETGDRNNLLLWEVLLSGSGIVLLYSLYRKKRKTQ